MPSYLVFILFVSISLVLYISYLYFSSIIGISRLTKIIQKISDGDYLQFIIRKSKNRIGRLEEAVESMSVKLAEKIKNLTTERAQISAVLSSMAEGVIAVNSSGKLILVNPAVEKMFGVLEPEILGKSLREALFNNEIAETIDQTLKTNEFIESELEIITPIKRTLDLHCNPIQDDYGLMSGVVCVIHDMTKIKELERYRSDFMANVSHELKTPLTSIRSYTETLLNGAINDQTNNLSFLEKIQKNTLSLAALIDDLLEISKLESKREVGPFEILDAVNIAKKTIEAISEKARGKNIRIIENYSDKIQIKGIEEHIYRAILNLLDNAINYSNEGGEVILSCRKNDGKYEISVEDHGIGIAPEHLSRIFERFYRVDKARAREVGGTGLGLAIVKHVINLHQGQVEVKSEEGKGSTFSLIFPL